MLLLSNQLQFFNTVTLCQFLSPPPTPNYRGEGYVEFILESLCCPSVFLSFSWYVRFCPDDISCTVQPFVIKLCMVVYYHEAECCEQQLAYCLQCQGHSKGLHKQHMTIFTVSSRLLVRLQLNLVW